RVVLEVCLCHGSAARVVEALTSAPARAGAILDSPVEAPPGLVFAFRLKADGTAEELTVDRPIAEDPEGWLWLAPLQLGRCARRSFLALVFLLSCRGARAARCRRR